MIYGKYLLRANQTALLRNPVSMILSARRNFASSTTLVKELRNMTGSPLKDCLKALEETEGDIQKAKDLLRKKGLADASKRTGRETTEGLIGVKLDKANNTLTIVEMHCETDFVAKTDQFIKGVDAVLNTIHEDKNLQVSSKESGDTYLLDKLMRDKHLSKPLDPDAGNQTIEDGIKYIISKT